MCSILPIFQHPSTQQGPLQDTNPSTRNSRQFLAMGRPRAFNTRKRRFQSSKSVTSTKKATKPQKKVAQPVKPPKVVKSREGSWWRSLVSKDGCNFIWNSLGTESKTLLVTDIQRCMFLPLVWSFFRYLPSFIRSCLGRFGLVNGWHFTG